MTAIHPARPQRPTLIAGLEIAPADPALLQAFAESCELEQAWEELIGVLSRSIPHLPLGTELEAFCRFYLGKASVELGLYSEARQHLERAVELKPDFGYTHQLLGRSCRQLGDVETALDAFRQATSLMNTFVWGWFDLGEILLEQGDPRESITALKQAKSLAGDLGDTNVAVIDHALKRAAEACIEAERQQLAAKRYPGVQVLSQIQRLAISVDLLHQAGSAAG